MSIRRVVCAAALSVVLSIAASPASASILEVGDYIKFNNREGSTAGGEFGIALWTGSPSDSSNDLFRTFCVQVNEFMNFNSKFEIIGISDHSADDGNLLRPATAALYEQFRMGATDFFGSGVTYDYTPNSNSHTKDANALQKAIWYFQDQPGYNNYASLSTRTKEFVDAANAFIADNPNFGIGNVRILNITFASGGHAQDQLYLMPQQGSLPTVPEPMSAIVWSGLGLVGLAVSRRMRRVTTSA